MPTPIEPVHANLGPSSAERWMNCPGSIAACAAVPPGASSIHSAAGTVAHALAEQIVTGKITAQALMARVGDTVMEQGFEVEIDEEMVDAAIAYRDIIMKDAEELRAEGKSIPIVAEAEIRVYAKSVDAKVYGTADFILHQKGNKLKVYDFKYGKGVVVNPQKNKQMAIYALGAMDGIAGTAYDEVELVIIQPRAGGDAVRRWTAPMQWLNEFREELKGAVAATRKPGATLVAGKWCRFCPAKSTCPVVYADVQKQAMIDFTAVPPTALAKGQLPDVAHLSIEKCSQALAFEDHVNSWFEAVKLRIRAQLDAGIEVPGWKLVDGRAFRKYTDEALVVSTFAPIIGEDALYEKKLISPAKLEVIVGKGKLEELNLTMKPEPKKSIARSDDPRPAAKNSAATDFEPVLLAPEPAPESDPMMNELFGLAPTPVKRLWP